MTTHAILPDTQCKPGLTYEHLRAAGNYILDKKPDVIIHLGDHWDMPSLSEYDKGKKCFEGRRYKEDIKAGHEGMAELLAPIIAYNQMQKKNKKPQYKPRMVFLMGNHEERIDRAIEKDAILEGTIGYEDLELDKWGWEVVPYREIAEIDGVAYSHFFYNPMTGKPYGGKAHTRLNSIGFSFTMGHQQGKDIAEKHLANGKTLRGLVCGSFYQHAENYKGPQGNHHWRGIIFKHEVANGDYCLLELSLDYLLKKWL